MTRRRLTRTGTTGRDSHRTVHLPRARSGGLATRLGKPQPRTRRTLAQHLRGA